VSQKYSHAPFESSIAFFRLKLLLRHDTRSFFLFRVTFQKLSQAGTKIDLGEIKTVYGLGQSLDLVFLGGCGVENNEVFPF
jgi:hypothetical protein